MIVRHGIVVGWKRYRVRVPSADRVLDEEILLKIDPWFLRLSELLVCPVPLVWHKRVLIGVDIQLFNPCLTSRVGFR